MTIDRKYDKGQLRGAYGAGFGRGVKEGAERMRREGWRQWQEGDQIPHVGQIVKTLTPTMAGWIGLGRVRHADRDSVLVWKLDKLTGDPVEDEFKTAELRCCEIAVCYVEEA